MSVPRAAQRRDDDANDVQPESTGPRSVAGRDPLEEVPVGCGDDAGIDALLHALGPKPMDFARLDESKEHALHAR